MGAGQSSPFAGVLLRLTSSTEVIPLEADIWEELWAGLPLNADQLYAAASIEQMRKWKTDAPKNFANLIRRAILKLHWAGLTAIATPECQNQVGMVVLLLMRLVPIVMEDPDWTGFFFTTLPQDVPMKMPEGHTQAADPKANNLAAVAPFPVAADTPLAHILLAAVLDLLFAPEYTVARTEVPRSAFMSQAPQAIRALNTVDATNYVWADGVAAAAQRGRSAGTPLMFERRTLLLRLLLVCLGSPLYTLPSVVVKKIDPWTQFILDAAHSKVLPLAQSLLNTVVSYDPVGLGLPYNYALFSDADHEKLVGVSAEVLLILLVCDGENVRASRLFQFFSTLQAAPELAFLSKGIADLLNNPLVATWLPHSQKKVDIFQELMVLFWRLVELNPSFMQHMLRSPDLLRIITPILHYVHSSRLDIMKAGLLHVGVYTLLLLSGERSFAVRLNAAYADPIVFDFPAFSGNYADLLVLVIHGLLTGTNQRLLGIYDCLLTILTNVSPYIKSLGLVAANKLVHLFEVFSSIKFLLAAPNNNHLIFFLLEIFNNLIQYQFEGNQHLVYVIIRRRRAFFDLQKLSLSPFAEAAAPAALPSDTTFVPGTPKSGKSGKTGKAEGDEKPPVIAASSPSEPVGEHFSTAAPRPEGFVPTQEWFDEWHSRLPLETVVRALQVLVPQIEALCSDKGVTDEVEILQFLQHGTLVGLLPVPHPLMVRKYHAPAAPMIWLISHVWGIIYLRSMLPPLWHGTNLRLLIVREE